MKLAKNRVNLLTSKVPALTTVPSVCSSSKTERHSEEVTPAESSAQLKFLPRFRWDFHSKSAWTSSSTFFRCLALVWTQLELWNAIRTIEFSIHLYIYHRLNLHFNTTLHYNLFNAYLLYLASATYSLWWCFFSKFSRQMVNKRITLSRPTFFVQRVLTFDAW